MAKAGAGKLKKYNEMISQLESEAFSSTVSKIAPVGIFQTDSDGKCLYVNELWSEITGLSLKEARGDGWAKALHADDRERVFQGWDKAAKNKQIFKSEYRFKRPDGAVTWVYGQSSSMIGADGTVEGYIGTITDITERKQAEDALLESELWMRSIFNSLDEGVLVVTPDRRFVNVNEAAQRIFGYSVDELINLSTETLHVDHQHYLEFGERIKRAFDKGQTANFEFEFKRKNGEVFLAENTISLLKNPAGEPIGIASVVRDITERKQAEESLRKNEERLRTYTQNSLDYIMVVNLEGKIEFINRTAPGLRREDVLETDAMQYIPAKSRTAMKNCFDRIKETGKPDKYEIEYQTPDGKVILFEARVSPIVREGKVVSYVINSNDITERKQAEIKLSESERDLKKAQEIAHLGHWSYDPETGLVQGSDELFRIYGISRNDSTFDGFASVMHPDDREGVRVAIQRSLENGEPFDITYRLLLDGMVLKWVHAIGESTLDETGKTKKLVGTSLDITERKQAEEELIRNKYYLEKAQELGNIGTWELDLKKNELLWTEENYRVFGVPQGTPLDYDIFLNCVHPDDREYVDREWTAAVNGKPYDIEHRLLVNGKVRWVREKAELTFGDDGQAVLAVGFTQNITERKQADEEKASHTHYLECMTRISAIFEQTYDTDKMLKLAIEEIFNIFQSDRAWLLYPCDPDAPSFRIPYETTRPEYPGGLQLNEEIPMSSESVEIFRRALATNDVLVFTHQVEDIHDGNAFKDMVEDFSIKSQMLMALLPKVGKPWLMGLHQCSHTRLWTDNEKKLFREISKSVSNTLTNRLMHQEIIAAKEEAERSNKAKSTFLSGMSHEVRTPLTSVIGFSNLLLSDTDQPLADSHRELLKKVIEGGDTLLALVDNVLDLSKIESETFIPSFEDVKVELLAMTAMDALAPLAKKHDVKLILKTASDDYYVRSDRTRTLQVFINILSNSIKYNKRGGEAVISYELLDQSKVRISITDTGPGIPENKIGDLFKPFDRMGMEGRNIPGTGIGLTIAKRLVELMGGKIIIESEVRKGSTFYIDLPVGKKPEPGADISVTALTGPASLGKDRSGTVLYIDDNKESVDLVKLMLKDWVNIEIISTDRAEEGVEVARTLKPDLILMDIGLPGMDGFEALKRLKQFDETRGIPVVVVSARAMKHEIDAGKAAGFDEYITKPISAEKLSHVLGAFLVEDTSD